MCKFYPKVLFVYLNDNQGAQDRSVDDCDDLTIFLSEKTTCFYLRCIHVGVLYYEWTDGEKERWLRLQQKRSYDWDSTECLSLGVLSRTNWYISLFLIKSWDAVVVLVGVVGVGVVMFVVSTQYLIYIVYMPLRFATTRHLRLLGPINSDAIIFLVPLCDEKRIHWYPWRTNISIIPRFMISSIGMDSPPPTLVHAPTCAFSKDSWI